MKLKLELFRYGSLVFGKVLEQAESLRTPGCCEEMESSPFGIFKISSDNSPELLSNVLFIRGSYKEDDNNIFSKNFADIDKAKEVVGLIKTLVDKINSDSPKGDSSSVERVL